MKIKTTLLKILIVSVAFSLTFTALGCSKQDQAVLQRINEIYEGLSLPVEVQKGDRLNLPSKVEEADITYSFDYPKYFDEEFRVIDDENTSKGIVLTTVIAIGDVSKTYTHNFKLLLNIDVYIDQIAEYVVAVIPSSTGKNINLRKNYYSIPDIIITYTSSNPEYVTNDGIYIHHDVDIEMYFICQITVRGTTRTFNIPFISVGIPNPQKVEVAALWLDEYMSEITFVDNMDLPSKHPLQGGRITWICNDPFVIYEDERLLLPEKAGMYTLYAEILFGVNSLVKEYRVNLPGLSRTKEERIEEFVTNMLPTSTSDYFVLYDGSGPTIDQSKMVDHEDPSIYRMFSGYHPTVPQSKLDSLFYPGYQMPNAANVLWIVVHETGNTTVGKDALVHADLQYNNAYFGYDRNASWHYQVDSYKIYQSYVNELGLWHASDGSTSGGGNANGIGIEMCVNCDGYYEVSMRNNARLIASLMIAFNLDLANLKQHNFFAPDGKNCPEQMRKAFRWFEFLKIIAREYVSQTLLSDVEITYQVTGLKSWGLAGLYEVTDYHDNDTITVVANYLSKSKEITTTYRS